MEMIRPWHTTIGKFNVADLCDLEMIAQEIFASNSIEGGAIRPLNDDQDPMVANMMDLRDRVITPKVLEYIKAEFGMDLKADEVGTATFCVSFADGDDMEPHIHGLSSLTVVMYPMASNAKMILMDPRGAACRGYPRPIRDRNFGNYRIDPQPGDVYIIPSYILHSVATVNNEYRISFINDYFIDEMT